MEIPFSVFINSAFFIQVVKKKIAAATMQASRNHHRRRGMEPSLPAEAKPSALLLSDKCVLRFEALLLHAQTLTFCNKGTGERQGAVSSERLPASGVE
jgi:hypothetical protein